MQALQDLLGAHAPAWSKQAYIHVSDTATQPVNLDEPGALYAAVHRHVTTPGPLAAKLRGWWGDSGPRSTVGSAELRGGTRAIVVVLTVDERGFGRVGDAVIWGNGLSVEVHGTQVEGRPCRDWVSEFLVSACDRLAPAFAHAQAEAEWWSKNMDTSRGAAAIGVDLSKALPGLYWMTYFGPELVRSLGESRLLSAPAPLVRAVGSGILIRSATDPSEWQSQEYAQTQQRVLAHLGPNRFYDRNHAARPTVPPSFETPADAK